MRYRTSRIPGTGLLGPRDVILCVHEGAGVRVDRRGLVRAGDGGAALNQELRDNGLRLRPVFAFEEHEQLRATAGTSAPGAPCDAPDLSTYYRVVAADANDGVPNDATALNEQLFGLDAVAAAYVQPSTVLTGLPTTVLGVPELPDAVPTGPTPDFSDRQGYLDKASAGGIDARFAWTRDGGRGQGVTLVDVEQAWCLTHEDLGLERGDLVGGVPPADNEARNHGTAVVGMLAAAHNGSGVMGICPDADVKAVSIFGHDGWTYVLAVKHAADRLVKGDIMLIEQMGPGPNRPRRPTAGDQRGYIPVEWWPLWLGAIQYAVSKGVIVVEAAGNGAEDLDADDYARGFSGFGTRWRNPFRPGGPDSGAIMVGAGAPPPGTHGEYDLGNDRSRLWFSNWGSRLDCQGWGLEVTTCGGRGNGADVLHPAADESRWYTDEFAGTSSAAPMVAGALACVQGILRAAGREPLTPTEARDALRETGVPQRSAPDSPVTERIGGRPDVRQLVDWALDRPSPNGGGAKSQRRRKGMTSFTVNIDNDGYVKVSGANGDAAEEFAPTGWKGPSLMLENNGSSREISWRELGELLQKVLAS
jgi:hypothetical protein